MMGNAYNSALPDTSSEGLYTEMQHLSVEQLRHLVRLIDQSDTLELEVKHNTAKDRLLLRKSRPAAHSAAPLVGGTAAIEIVSSSAAEQKQYTVTAPFVGLFQPWSVAKDRPLVAIGDVVKEGQYVGVIRSLGIPNEVVAPVSGRVIELLVQDGQAVEYGQPLLKIEK